MNSKKKLILLSFTIGFMFLSCNRVNNVYFEYSHIPSEGWAENHILKFRPHITETDQEYDIDIELRHNDEYSYRNIYLFVSMAYNDSVTETDTIQYMLSDESGKWFGNGYNALYQQTLQLRKMYSFQDTGVYEFRIRQAMRDDLLIGIEDVGLKIEKTRVR